MKNITTKQFQILTDNQLAWDFLVDIYDPAFSNGVAAPFFEYALTSSWMDRSQLHRNRFWFDGDMVVAFVFHENPTTSIFFALRPGYEALAEELITYAEQYMPNFNNEQELVLFAGQTALLQAAEKRGYQLIYQETDHAFDFATSELNAKLPEGFHFVDPSDCDPVKLARCMWKGFDHEDKGPFENWEEPSDSADWTPYQSYLGIISATMAPPPHSTYEYNVIIADENEEYACFSGMWWVDKNKLAYMEPLCTIPEHRRKGLAIAALSEHYRRLKPLGATRMTGGGDPFYQKIGYQSGIVWNHMRKA